MKKVLLITAAAVSLAACGSTIETAGVVKSESTTLVQEMKMPTWYVTLPTKTGSIYSAGTAVSGDLQLATDLAVHNAKYVLADRINGKLKAQTRSFVSEVSVSADQTAIIKDIERVSENNIVDVDVAGYTVADTVIVKENGRFRVYALLDYSDVEVNKILLNRLSKSSKVRATEAFQRLEAQTETVDAASTQEPTS